MASGSAPPSEQRASAGGKEKVGGVGRGRRAANNTTFHHNDDGIVGHHIGHCEICVVCGDRACNHHYYGIVSCHGCKCFFWRSIKNKMKYICRGNGQCNISPNQRNACRYCRLQRCLKAGMQPEAVRMPKATMSSEITGALTNLEEAMLENGRNEQNNKSVPEEATFSVETKGSGGKCPLCHSHPQQKQQQNVKGVKKMLGEKSVEIVEDHHPTQNQKLNKMAFELEKKQSAIKDINRNGQEKISEMLVKKLCQIEMTINEVVDFSENEAPKRQLRLASLFDYPEFLDRFRTQVNYCVRLRRVTEEEIEFCKYRMLTKVVDYISSLSALDPANPLVPNFAGLPLLTTQDKIVLLRHGFAPLVLFDIATGTSFTTRDVQNLLLLPTGITLSAEEPIVPNTFISQQIVSRCIGSLVRALQELQLDQAEFVMLKLIILALSLDSTESGGNINDDGTKSTTTMIDEIQEPITTNHQLFNPPRNTNCSNNNYGEMSNVVVVGDYRLSSDACLFVEKLRDFAYSALYQHSPKKTGLSDGECSSSSADSAALRFGKILNILPKLTLLSRDLEEFIRMVHTFPTSRTRPTDPIFFQLFGDIFQQQQQMDGHHHSNNYSSLSGAPTPSSLYGGSPFGIGIGSPQQQQQQSEGQHKEGVNPFTAKAKMVSPPYKIEYGGSTNQFRMHFDGSHFH